MSDLLSGLDALRVDLASLDVPDDIAGTDNERLYRANAVGRDNGIDEAAIYVREALLNPTDEQVSAIVAATVWTGRLTPTQVRAVLAAAAGGDEAQRLGGDAA